jgi:hypothetical protein
VGWMKVVNCDVNNDMHLQPRDYHAYTNDGIKFIARSIFGLTQDYLHFAESTFWVS